MFRCWSYLFTYLVIGFVGDRGRDDRGKFLYFTAIVSGLNCTCNFANNLYVWFVFAGGGGGDMMEMVDTIFVSGLPEDIDEDGLVQHFGSIGVIKVCIR